MPPLMVMADSQGRLFEHPDLWMVGALGSEAVAPDLDELSPLPEGSRFFTLPDSLPVGGDPEADELATVDEADWGEGPETPQAACTFPAPGWMRTLLPFSERAEGAPTLPLWAYTALGFDPGEERFVCAAVQVDDCPRWAPEEYDDRDLPERLGEMKAKFPRNRMVPHLERCAAEFHCFAAKNFFAGRWEMGLPIAPLCNADCRGCISLQTDDLFPASHERITFVPSPEELAGIAAPHLESAEKAVASFGQGCEGEPLLQAGIIESACRLIRERTGDGTLHLPAPGEKVLGREAVELGRAALEMGDHSVPGEFLFHPGEAFGKAPVVVFPGRPARTVVHLDGGADEPFGFFIEAQRGVGPEREGGRAFAALGEGEQGAHPAGGGKRAGRLGNFGFAAPVHLVDGDEFVSLGVAADGQALGNGK